MGSLRGTTTSSGGCSFASGRAWCWSPVLFAWGIEIQRRSTLQAQNTIKRNSVIERPNIVSTAIIIIVIIIVVVIIIIRNTIRCTTGWGIIVIVGSGSGSGSPSSGLVIGMAEPTWKADASLGTSVSSLTLA